ncbi:hypothetical protein K0M31_009113 [Melipona bicolor]|uniref:Uncharacterized protein n=1 Tax=Melipona bicolor TaxID=60889 RepID=A0AA40FPY1_9HYME|nr:hypothetical protein K0M31_009113 [Melipona bicolor]
MTRATNWPRVQGVFLKILSNDPSLAPLVRYEILAEIVKFLGNRYIFQRSKAPLRSVLWSVITVAFLVRSSPITDISLPPEHPQARNLTEQSLVAETTMKRHTLYARVNPARR